jgi:hypothetical protein
MRSRQGQKVQESQEVQAWQEQDVQSVRQEVQARLEQGRDLMLGTRQAFWSGWLARFKCASLGAENP